MRILHITCIIFLLCGCIPHYSKYNNDQIYIVNATKSDIDVVVQSQDRNGTIGLTYYTMPRLSEVRIFFDIHSHVLFFEKGIVSIFFDKYGKFLYFPEEFEEFSNGFHPLFSLDVKDIYLRAKPHLNPKSATCMFLNESWEYEFLSQYDTPWSDAKGGKVCGAPNAERATIFILN